METSASRERRFWLVIPITVLSVFSGLGCAGSDSAARAAEDAAAAPDLAPSTGGFGASAGTTGTGAEAESGSGGSGGCPAGFVWMVSGDSGVYPHLFNSFCGQPCAASSDCPAGMTCVLELWSMATPRVPVCVSDSVPPPLSSPVYIPHEDYGPTCRDSATLGKGYYNPKTGFYGYEVIPCPNGCQSSALPYAGSDFCSDTPLD